MKFVGVVTLENFPEGTVGRLQLKALPSRLPRKEVKRSGTPAGKLPQEWHLRCSTLLEGTPEDLLKETHC